MTEVQQKMSSHISGSIEISEEDMLRTKRRGKIIDDMVEKLQGAVQKYTVQTEAICIENEELGPVLRNAQHPPLLRAVIFKLETFGLYFHSFLEHLRWIILSKSQAIGGFHGLKRAESVRHLFLVF